MAKLPYFKWYPSEAEVDDDWRAMTMAQRGLFVTLLNVSWMNNGLPMEDERIARIAGLSLEDFSDLWAAVKVKFIERDCRLVNERQEKDRREVVSKSNKSRQSAESRWSIRNANALPTHCERIEFAMPRAYDSDSSSVVSISSPKKETPRNLDHGQRFEEWWGLWSGFMGTNHHGAACTAWLSVVTPEVEEELFECTRSYRDSRRGAGGYNPENFLFDQSRDKFKARWPPARDPTKRRMAITDPNFWGGEAGEAVHHQ